MILEFMGPMHMCESGVCVIKRLKPKQVKNLCQRNYDAQGEKNNNLASSERKSTTLPKNKCNFLRISLIIS